MLSEQLYLLSRLYVDLFASVIVECFNIGGGQTESKSIHLSGYSHQY